MSLALVGQSLPIHTDRQNRHGRQAYARAQRRASLLHRDRRSGKGHYMRSAARYHARTYTSHVFLDRNRPLLGDPRCALTRAVALFLRGPRGEEQRRPEYFAMVRFASDPHPQVLIMNI